MSKHLQPWCQRVNLTRNRHIAVMVPDWRGVGAANELLAQLVWKHLAKTKIESLFYNSQSSRSLFPNCAIV